MSRLLKKARLLARSLHPNRNWFPLEAWDDERYDRFFSNLRTQAADLEAQQIAAESSTGPKFSIVVPLFKTPHDYLDDMVESVVSQTYPNWELVLVNASPELSDLKSWVHEYVDADKRIKTIELDENYGITENTNKGISIATGEFVSFMDHDDWLEPDALFEYASAVNTHPDIDLLYCDEDLVEKTNGAWHYCHPLFKPDFSPELLLCKNYIVHLLTVRTTIINSISTPGSEFDGAQDYNMSFLASEKARRIHHVRRVLYHWRMSENSTAANSAAKPYGKRAYRLSAQRHLERTDTQGSIVGTGIVNIHNIWFNPATDAKISVVVTYGDQECNPSRSFEAFIESFEQNNTYENVEFLFASSKPTETTFNPRTDNAFHFVQCDSSSTIFERFNQAAHEADGEILVFLDTSCLFVSPEPLEQLVGLLAHPGVGIVGPKILYADYSVKSYGVGISTHGIVPLYRGYALDHPSYQCNTRAFQNTSAIGCQGLSITQNLFQSIGGFDAEYDNEIASVSLCQRAIEKKLRIATSCTVQLLTAEPAPDSPFSCQVEFDDYPKTDVIRYKQKQLSRLPESDPYRSPYIDQMSSHPIIDFRCLQSSR